MLRKNLFLLSLCGLLYGCAPLAPTQHPQATLDLNGIRTAAAGTAFVELTHSAQSATPMPLPTQTATLRPTSTLHPTLDASLTPRPILIVTPVNRVYVPFDIDGFEHLPQMTAGKTIELNDEQKKKIAENLHTSLKLGKNFPDLPEISQSFQIDFDDDEKAEILVGYEYEFPRMSEIGLAIIDYSTYQVIHFTEPENFFFDNKFRLVPIKLSSTQTGIFFQNFSQTGGSGVYGIIYRRLYIWDSGVLHQVWEWNNDAGGQIGIFNQLWRNIYVQFQYLTGNTFPDIVLEAQNRQISISEHVQTNYWWYFPGKLVFSWDKERYKLSYYYDGKKLTPIHSHESVITSNGEWPHDVAHRLSATTSYDMKNVILHISASSDDLIEIGLDIDLTGDFASKVIDQDDFVFNVQIPKDCLGEAEITPISSAAQKIRIAKSSIQKHFLNCYLQVTIPRSDLYLDEKLMYTPEYVLAYKDEYGFPVDEIHMGLEKLIGIAVQLKQFSNTFGFDMSDPTTWGTLIFTSDH